jgi:hypothetical protein
LRLPRIGPVVTANSVLAGMSAIFVFLPLNRGCRAGNQAGGEEVGAEDDHQRAPDSGCGDHRPGKAQPELRDRKQRSPSAQAIQPAAETRIAAGLVPDIVDGDDERADDEGKSAGDRDQARRPVELVDDFGQRWPRRTAPKPPASR